MPSSLRIVARGALIDSAKIWTQDGKHLATDGASLHFLTLVGTAPPTWDTRCFWGQLAMYAPLGARPQHAHLIQPVDDQIRGLLR